MCMCAHTGFMANYTQTRDEGINSLLEENADSQRLGNLLKRTDSMSDQSHGFRHVIEAL